MKSTIVFLMLAITLTVALLVFTTNAQTNTTGNHTNGSGGGGGGSGPTNGTNSTGGGPPGNMTGNGTNSTGGGGGGGGGGNNTNTTPLYANIWFYGTGIPGINGTNQTNTTNSTNTTSPCGFGSACGESDAIADILAQIAQPGTWSGYFTAMSNPSANVWIPGTAYGCGSGTDWCVPGTNMLVEGLCQSSFPGSAGLFTGFPTQYWPPAAALQVNCAALAGQPKPYGGFFIGVCATNPLGGYCN